MEKKNLIHGRGGEGVNNKKITKNKKPNHKKTHPQKKKKNQTVEIKVHSFSVKCMFPPTSKGLFTPYRRKSLSYINRIYGTP